MTKDWVVRSGGRSFIVQRVFECKIRVFIFRGERKIKTGEQTYKVEGATGVWIKDVTSDYVSRAYDGRMSQQVDRL